MELKNKIIASVFGAVSLLSVGCSSGGGASADGLPIDSPSEPILTLPDTSGVSDECRATIINNGLRTSNGVPDSIDLLQLETVSVAIVAPDSETGKLEAHPYLDAYQGGVTDAGHAVDVYGPVEALPPYIDGSIRVALSFFHGGEVEIVEELDSADIVVLPYNGENTNAFGLSTLPHNDPNLRNAFGRQVAMVGLDTDILSDISEVNPEFYKTLSYRLTLHEIGHPHGLLDATFVVDGMIASDDPSCDKDKLALFKDVNQTGVMFYPDDLSNGFRDVTVFEVANTKALRRFSFENFIPIPQAGSSSGLRQKDFLKEDGGPAVIAH